MAPTTDLLLLALVVLIAFVIAGRAYMAWQWLAAAAARARRQAAALDDGTVRLMEGFLRIRSSLATLDAELEQTAIRVRRLDEGLERQVDVLAAARAGLERFRTTRMPAAGEALARARTVARVVVTAVRLRRSLQA